MQFRGIETTPLAAHAPTTITSIWVGTAESPARERQKRMAASGKSPTGSSSPSLAHMSTVTPGLVWASPGLLPPPPPRPLPQPGKPAPSRLPVKPVSPESFLAPRRAPTPPHNKPWLSSGMGEPGAQRRPGLLRRIAGQLRSVTSRVNLRKETGPSMARKLSMPFLRKRTEDEGDEGASS